MALRERHSRHRLSKELVHSLAEQARSAGTQSPSIFSVLSDKRAKENIKKIGKLFDGQSVYRYNYKGDRTTRIGLMAQNVEKEHPDAIHEISGLKTVDYDEATKAAAKKKHFARGGLAFDDGGSVNDDYTNSLIGYDALAGDLIGGEKADQLAATQLHLANGGIANTGVSVNVLGGAPGSPSIPNVSMTRGSGPPTPGKVDLSTATNLDEPACPSWKHIQWIEQLGSGLMLPAA